MNLLHNNYFFIKMSLAKIKTWIDPCTYNNEPDNYIPYITLLLI